MPRGPTPHTTRLAPSPTGALHLGNARTFLINWAMARQAGWRVVLRIEDLDGPRIKRDADRQAIDVLRWLGLDWDDGPLYQSHNLAPYRAALEALHRRGRVYPCRCTRREIEAAQSAPHGDEHELRYPGTCRPAPANPAPPAAERPELTLDDADVPAYRLIVPDGPVRFDDTVHGPQAVDVSEQVGDFVVATKAALPAYQLAVVVDDARQGVTQVVRGDDLLRSTARQILLYEDLGLGDPPTYTHLPLVLGPDGRRLAKRHGDTRLLAYRDRGASPERIIGLLAAWSGVARAPEPMTAAAFAERFRLGDLPRDPACFTEEDHRWLLAETLSRPR